MVSELENFAENNTEADAYNFEKGIVKILQENNKQLFQASLGKLPKGENSKVKIKTTLGEMIVPKNHPMSMRPMGFRISPCLQEHICRLGSKLVFSEASEEFWQFLEIDVPDKQVERVCHCYGEKLDELDWANAYSDSIHLKLNHQDEDPIYAMVDGSMLLTREESWREIKVGRVFSGSSLIGISKSRTLLCDSVYAAHLGSAPEFWERFSAEIPLSNKLVFINDGARWIWKYIEECYPNSIQILDFFHCKEHICQFSKEFFGKQKAREFAEKICDMLLNERVNEALEKIKSLDAQSTKKISEKEKLLGYLENNKGRINYGKYKKMGLLIGSGAIESAQRDVIQKRMKQSGQRWTIKGAQQIVNLRVYKKSGHWGKVVDCIKDEKFWNKKAA
jgi:hypothetical protein